MFVNPPYSTTAQNQWVKKCYEESIKNKNIEIEDSQGKLHKGKLEYYDNGSHFKLVMDDNNNQVIDLVHIEEDKLRDES